MSVVFYPKNSQDIDLSIANQFAFKLMELLRLRKSPEGRVRSSVLLDRIGKLRRKLEVEAPVFIVRPSVCRGQLSPGLTLQRFLGYLEGLESLANQASEVRWT